VSAAGRGRESGKPRRVRLSLRRGFERRMSDQIDESAVADLAQVGSPKDFPRAWLPWFVELTGTEHDYEWGLRAAVMIARYRKRHGRGPTFAELFEQLERASDDFAQTKKFFAQGKRAEVYRFRNHVAVHWRRLGWIQWDRGSRSLRVGRTFRAASHEWSARSARAQE
jgi:hypothetical protein